MNEINIKFASDEFTEALRKNPKTVVEKMHSSPSDNSWIHSMNAEDAFLKKKYTIEDFSLEKPNSEKDYDVIYRDAIILYEHLKGLPEYILSDERFWLWLMFDKFYEICLILMPVDKESTFMDHWLYTQGKRRGIFFGVLARLYFRVALSVDESLEDPYYYTKFCFENQYRIRELTWRSFSSERHIVLGALKGIKRYLDEHSDIVEDNDSYPVLAKDISQLGSAKLLDVMDQDYIEEKTYGFLDKYYNNKK